MRLEVTRKTDLAIAALVELTTASERLKTAQLAERLHAAPGFLAQVLTELVRQHWVQSSPGPTGGYCLAVDPSSVLVLDVLEAMEGPTKTDRCVVVDAPCGTDGYCPIHEGWTKARDVLLAYLSSTTIETVANRQQLGG